MDKSIIAIDGFAATGKSTIAERLSKHLGIPHVDSGAFYRGITFLALEKGWITDNNIDETSIGEGIEEVKINFDSISNTLTLNKRDITYEEALFIFVDVDGDFFRYRLVFVGYFK